MSVATNSAPPRDDILKFIDSHDVETLLDRLKAQVSNPDHHWYEPTWNRLLLNFVAVIRRGERSLSRVLELAILKRYGRDFLRDRQERYWLGELSEGSAELIFHERRAMRNVLLRQACDKETDCVVELGSGPGYHAFWFWLSGGPRDARYLAFEITQIGRLCTEILAKLEPQLSIEAHPYDFYTPDYSAIPSGLRHLVVYTAGAIEQIGVLPEEALTGFLDKAQRVTVIHWEPISWQFIERPTPADEAHRARCVELGYNQTLWPTLKKLEAEGRIVIEDFAPNVMGKIHHPAGFIRWRKA